MQFKFDATLRKTTCLLLLCAVIFYSQECDAYRRRPGPLSPSGPNQQGPRRVQQPVPISQQGLDTNPPINHRRIQSYGPPPKFRGKPPFPFGRRRPPPHHHRGPPPGYYRPHPGMVSQQNGQPNEAQNGPQNGQPNGPPNNHPNGVQNVHQNGPQTGQQSVLLPGAAPQSSQPQLSFHIPPAPPTSHQQPNGGQLSQSPPGGGSPQLSNQQQLIQNQQPPVYHSQNVPQQQQIQSNQQQQFQIPQQKPTIQTMSAPPAPLYPSNQPLFSIPSQQQQQSSFTHERPIVEYAPPPHGFNPHQNIISPTPETAAKLPDKGKKEKQTITFTITPKPIQNGGSTIQFHISTPKPYKANFKSSSKEYFSGSTLRPPGYRQKNAGYNGNTKDNFYGSGSNPGYPNTEYRIGDREKLADDIRPPARHGEESIHHNDDNAFKDKNSRPADDNFGRGSYHNPIFVKNNPDDDRRKPYTGPEGKPNAYNNAPGYGPPEFEKTHYSKDKEWINYSPRPSFSDSNYPHKEFDQSKEEYGPSPRPDFGPSPRPDFGPSPRPDFGPSPRPDFGPSPRPDFGPSERPDFGPSERPDFGPSERPDYGPSNGPDFRPSDGSDFEPSEVPDFGPSKRPEFGPSERPDFGEHERPDFGTSKRPAFGPSDRPDFDSSRNDGEPSKSEYHHKDDFESHRHSDFDPSKEDYENRRDEYSQPKDKHNYDPSKEDFGSSRKEYDNRPSKHDYDEPRKEYRPRYEDDEKNSHQSDSKYSQPDPLYHPEGDLVKSSEVTAMKPPPRFDNSYSSDYNKKDNDYNGYHDSNKVIHKQGTGHKQLAAEEVLAALGLSTDPLVSVPTDLHSASSQSTGSKFNQPLPWEKHEFSNNKQPFHSPGNAEPLNLMDYLKLKQQEERPNSAANDPLFQSPEKLAPNADRPGHFLASNEGEHPANTFLMHASMQALGPQSFINSALTHYSEPPTSKLTGVVVGRPISGFGAESAQTDGSLESFSLLQPAIGASNNNLSPPGIQNSFIGESGTEQHSQPNLQSQSYIQQRLQSQGLENFGLHAGSIGGNFGISSPQTRPTLLNHNERSDQLAPLGHTSYIHQKLYGNGGSNIGLSASTSLRSGAYGAGPSMTASPPSGLYGSGHLSSLGGGLNGQGLLNDQVNSQSAVISALYSLERGEDSMLNAQSYLHPKVHGEPNFASKPQQHPSDEELGVGSSAQTPLLSGLYGLGPLGGHSSVSGSLYGPSPLVPSTPTGGYIPGQHNGPILPSFNTPDKQETHTQSGANSYIQRLNNLLGTGLPMAPHPQSFGPGPSAGPLQDSNLFGQGHPSGELNNFGPNPSAASPDVGIFRPGPSSDPLTNIGLFKPGPSSLPHGIGETAPLYSEPSHLGSNSFNYQRNHGQQPLNSLYGSSAATSHQPSFANGGAPHSIERGDSVSTGSQSYIPRLHGGHSNGNGIGHGLSLHNHHSDMFGPRKEASDRISDAGYYGPSTPSYNNFGPTSRYGEPYPVYLTEPDPIIEIIVQDSNVTLPPPPPTLPPPPPPPLTPEPVHVFYVRYSQKNNTLGGFDTHYAGSEPQINLETPVASIPVRGPDRLLDIGDSDGASSIHTGYTIISDPSHQQQYSQPQLQQQNQLQHQQNQQLHQQNQQLHQQNQQLQQQNQQQHQQQNQQQHNQQQNQQQHHQQQNQQQHHQQQNQQQHQQENQQQHQQLDNQQHHYQQLQLQHQQTLTTTEAPSSTTTLRTIIRPDKNEYTPSKLAIAFDHPPAAPLFNTQPQPLEPHQQHVQSLEQQHQESEQHPVAYNSNQQQSHQEIMSFPPSGQHSQQQQPTISYQQFHQNQANQQPQSEIAQQSHSDLSMLDPAWGIWNRNGALESSEHPNHNYNQQQQPNLGPVYPGFNKRMGLEELASLLETSEQQNRQQQDDSQHKQQQYNEQLQQQAGSQQQFDSHQHDQSYQPEQQQDRQQEQQQDHQHTYQQEQPQQNYQAQQPDGHISTRIQQSISLGSGGGRGPVAAKLPDDVPEELRQQLMSSGILGNADVQVINFDENLFKELGDLPPEALAALQAQAGGSADAGKSKERGSSVWDGGSMSLPGDADLSALLGHARSLRSVLVVKNSLRPKRGGKQRRCVLLITDTDEVLLYNPKKKVIYRVGTTSSRPVIARAIELSHHNHNVTVQ